MCSGQGVRQIEIVNCILKNRVLGVSTSELISVLNVMQMVMLVVLSKAKARFNIDPTAMRARFSLFNE